AVGRDDGDRKVAVVDVDGHGRVLPQLLQGRGGDGRDLPRSVDVPAATRRVVADVVTDRAGGRLGGDLVSAVGKPDRAGQPVAAAPRGPGGSSAPGSGPSWRAARQRSRTRGSCPPSRRPGPPAGPRSGGYGPSGLTARPAGSARPAGRRPRLCGWSLRPTRRTIPP